MHRATSIAYMASDAKVAKMGIEFGDSSAR